MLPVIIADPITVKKGRRRGFMVSPPLACTRLRCIGSPGGATSTTTPNSIKDGCKRSQMDSPCLPSMKCIEFGAQGLFFSRRGSAPRPSPYPPLDSHTCRSEGPVPDPGTRRCVIEHSGVLLTIILHVQYVFNVFGGRPKYTVCI